MICHYCSLAGKAQAEHRSNPTPEIEQVIKDLYDSCKGCYCAKKIEWGNVIRKPSA